MLFHSRDGSTVGWKNWRKDAFCKREGKRRGKVDDRREGTMEEKEEQRAFYVGKAARLR